MHQLRLRREGRSDRRAPDTRRAGTDSLPQIGESLTLPDSAVDLSANGSAPMKRPVLLAWIALCCLSATVGVFAQTSVERFNRQLEQIQRETTLQADTSVPIDQRTLLDYGGYL